jgi:hypothetical protein
LGVSARERGKGAGKLLPVEVETFALDLQTHKERPGIADVLVGGEDITVVHSDERTYRNNVRRCGLRPGYARMALPG